MSFHKASLSSAHYVITDMDSLQISRDLLCQAKISHHRCIAVVITFDQAVLRIQKTLSLITGLDEEVATRSGG